MSDPEPGADSDPAAPNDATTGPDSGRESGGPTAPSAGPRRGIDPAGAAVGTLVALSGVLFLLQVAVDFLVVGPVGVRPVVLSAATLSVAMLVGGVLFWRQRRRTLAIGHAGTGAGWALLLVGTLGGSGVALLLGAGLVGGTALFLVAERRRR